MTYEEWEEQVTLEIRKGPVWKFNGYRKALFLQIWFGLIVSIGRRRGVAGPSLTRQYAVQDLSAPISRRVLAVVLGAIMPAF